jgi:hypothetical protein
MKIAGTGRENTKMRARTTTITVDATVHKIAVICSSLNGMGVGQFTELAVLELAANMLEGV